MISILSDILCAILRLAVTIPNALVWVVNQLIAAIGAGLQAAINLLPEMWEPPDPPEEGILNFINWFIPLAPMAAALGLALALAIGWFIFKIGWARWME